MNDIFLTIRNIFILVLVLNWSFTGEAKAQAVVDIQIESVSVEMDGSISIKYTLVDELNIVDEIKVRYIEVLGDPSDYVFSTDEIHPSGTIILNNDNNDYPVNLQSVSFQLEAYEDNIPLDYSHIHSSLFFDDIESTSDNCLLAVQTSWSNYAKYPGNLSFQFPPEFDRLYIVSYVYEDDDCNINTRSVINQSPITPLIGPQDAELIFNQNPGKYCFRLEASNSDNQIATSNTIVTDIDDFDVPVHIEILSVNVLNNEAIEVQLEVDEFGFSEFEYRLYRSDNASEYFKEIGRMDHSSSILFFVDNQVPDFSLNPWYYHAKVDIKDCPGNHTKPSGIASSVFLEANIPDFEPASANKVPVNLSWKHLPEWDQYELFSLESTGVTLIETFNAPPYEYSHQINIEGLTETVLSFRLEATKGSLKVHSNIAQVRIEPILFPPRASGQRHALLPSSELLIDGEYPNRFFRPTFVFPYINYTMNIFDRNGQLMFSTNDDSEPWDGNINGQKDKPAPAGAYVFEVRLTDIGGTSHQKKGVVYLIR